MSQPSVTLCVQNINYSIVKKDEARRALYCLFGSYGKVIDVVYTRAAKVRGTAFVVFRDLASSTAAMRGLDGESFYGKSLRISYAKSTSHATVGQTEGPEAVYAIKLGLRDVDGNTANGNKTKLTVSGAQKKLSDDRREKRARDNEEEEEEDESSDEDGPAERKKGRQDEDDGDEAMMEESDDEDAPGPAAAAGEGSGSSPSLQVEGLPAEVTTEMLTALFQQYPGLATVRLNPTLPDAAPKSGSALVQFESAAQASVAKDALDGFLVDRDAPIQVHFAASA
ncbi:uncharacterized protein RHOBADRAFT_41413 [Rhodotorula graminis WP1]|uniref:RRM domain-containing protein n=1 Tax=Rhodotorula graminis (strain WP1) TaxID=578459 RepID=A0A194SDE7_RHOGW|nr:uncharacterized protein RHOBADRAFT_41413 [Rhodotorula graminis WP1]KPV77421.1 hypothetical protein RHOBADRAFT_41413 [Rhodotorula graminis WP1]